MSTTTALRQVNGVEIPQPGTYAIDRSHSTVEFVGRHLMITKVRGRFAEFDGEIRIADAPEESSTEVTIQAASIATADEKRDGHLRSATSSTSSSTPRSSSAAPASSRARAAPGS